MARVTSLFELQQSVDGTRRAPDRARAAAARNAGRRATRAPSRRQKPANGRPVSFAVDHGEPIELAYGDAVVHAASVAREAVAFGAPAGPAASVPGGTTTAVLAPFEAGERDTTHALSAAFDATAGYTVESFEADDLAPADDVPAQRAPAVVEAVESAAEQASAMARARRTEHVDAFERELRGLVDRQQQSPADEQPSPPPPAEPAHGPAPTTPTRYDHGVFDAMAGGMSYATTFEHRPVALKRVFAEFDRELDRASGVVTPPTSFPDAPAVAHALGAGMPEDAVLAADLDAFDAGNPPAPLAPTAVEPTAGETEPAPSSRPAPVNPAVADDQAASDQDSTTP